MAQSTRVFIAAGDLRHQINILQQTPVMGATGNIPTWTTFASGVACKVTSLRGADAWRSGQYTSEKYQQVVMRYRPGIVSNMRIAFGARTFVVEDVVNVGERNIRIELLCVELDGQ